MIPPNTTRCEHAAKATGWGGLSLISTIAIPIIAGAVVAVAVGLPVWDISFLYGWSAITPVHLTWGIPVTIAFLALDVAVIIWLGQGALRLIQRAHSTATQSKLEAQKHFHLAHAPAASRS